MSDVTQLPWVNSSFRICRSEQQHLLSASSSMITDPNLDQILTALCSVLHIKIKIVIYTTDAPKTPTKMETQLC